MTPCEKVVVVRDSSHIRHQSTASRGRAAPWPAVIRFRGFKLEAHGHNLELANCEEEKWEMRRGD